MNMYQSQVVKQKEPEPRSGFSPTLDTVRMVAQTIRDSPNSLVTRGELKRSLPRQVNHYALQNALDFLSEINWIYIGAKGIVWTHNTNPNLRRAIANGRRV